MWRRADAGQTLALGSRKDKGRQNAMSMTGLRSDPKPEWCTVVRGCEDVVGRETRLICAMCFLV